MVYKYIIFILLVKNWLCGQADSWLHTFKEVLSSKLGRLLEKKFGAISSDTYSDKYMSYDNKSHL